MEITIENLAHNTSTGVATKVHWSANKSWEGRSVSVDMVTPLRDISPNAPSFIQFDNLTVSDVKSWLTQSGDVSKAEVILDTKLLAQAESLSVPPSWNAS